MIAPFQFIRPIVCLATLAVASAFGDTFEYAYTFLSGDVVSGRFDGTLSGDLISHISKATLVINGVEISSPIFEASYDDASGRYRDGEAVASLDGSKNNFFFINSDVGDDDFTFTSYFYSLPELGFAAGALFGQGDPYFLPDEEMFSRSWTVTSVTQGVPDSASTLGLLGLSILGLACFRPRRQVSV